MPTMRRGRRFPSHTGWSRFVPLHITSVTKFRFDLLLTSSLNSPLRSIPLRYWPWTNFVPPGVQLESNDQCRLLLAVRSLSLRKYGKPERNFYASRFWIYGLFHRLSPRHRQSTSTRKPQEASSATLFGGSVTSQSLISQSTTLDI